MNMMKVKPILQPTLKIKGLQSNFESHWKDWVEEAEDQNSNLSLMPKRQLSLHSLTSSNSTQLNLAEIEWVQDGDHKLPDHSTAQQIEVCQHMPTDDYRSTDPSLPSTSHDLNVNARREHKVEQKQVSKEASGRKRSRQAKPKANKSSNSECTKVAHKRPRRSKTQSRSRSKTKRKRDHKSRSSKESSCSDHNVTVTFSSHFRATPCPSENCCHTRRVASPSTSRSRSNSSKSSVRSRVSWKDSRDNDRPAPVCRPVTDHNHSRSRSGQKRSSSTICQKCGGRRRPPSCHCNDSMRNRKSSRSRSSNRNSSPVQGSSNRNSSPVQGSRNNHVRRSRSRSRSRCSVNRSRSGRGNASESRHHDKKGGGRSPYFCLIM